jgi:transcriptional regulator with XRE-family HTH domain
MLYNMKLFVYDDSMRFGEWLREQRTKRALSMRELAALAEVSSVYISRLEANPESTPSREVVARIAHALNASPAEAYLAAGYAPPQEGQVPEQTARLVHRFEQLPEESKMILLDVLESLYANASRSLDTAQRKSVRRTTATSRKKRGLK